MGLRLPSVDVARMDLPMSHRGHDWVMTVEAAVVPGHGEVSATACRGESACFIPRRSANAYYGSEHAHREYWLRPPGCRCTSRVVTMSCG